MSVTYNKGQATYIKGSEYMHRFLLSNTLNTRDLGGYPTECGKVTSNKAFLRSDVLAKVSDDDIKLLLSSNITTIVDLRNDDEVLRKPCALENDENFEYHHCKIYGDGCLPISACEVPNSYFEMIDEQKTVLNIMRIFAKAKGGVLYNCTAGKDRTGVISALLLLLCGVLKIHILDDYQISNVYLGPMLQRFCKTNKDVDINIVTPKREYMEKFLDMFHQKYNSVEEYLTKIGLSDTEVLQLKTKLINYAE